MKKKNLKDIISNACGFILTVSGAIIAASSAGVAIPAVVLTYAIVGGTISGGVIAWLTGKPLDLKKDEKLVDKTAEQINESLKKD